jgi:hypothetical protein
MGVKWAGTLCRSLNRQEDPPVAPSFAEHGSNARSMP